MFFVGPIRSKIENLFGTFLKTCSSHKRHGMVPYILMPLKLAILDFQLSIITNAVPTLEIKEPLFNILCAPTNILSVFLIM